MRTLDILKPCQSAWLIIKAVVQIFLNPYSKPKRKNRKIFENSDEDSDEDENEDSEVSRRTEIDLYI